MKKGIKRKFTQQEDEIISKLVEKYGMHHWTEISQQLTNRTSRQCRERWKHYLNAPKSSSWTEQEDSLLLQKFNEYGAKWTQIQQFFPTKTSVNIKNRYSLLKRREKKKEQQMQTQIKLQTPPPPPPPTIKFFPAAIAFDPFFFMKDSHSQPTPIFILPPRNQVIFSQISPDTTVCK